MKLTKAEYETPKTSIYYHVKRDFLLEVRISRDGGWYETGVPIEHRDWVIRPVPLAGGRSMRIPGIVYVGEL